MERSKDGYELAVAEHRWEVPEHYNIAVDVCDRHPRQKLAMIHEHFSGALREVSWGELQDLSNRFANVLAGQGVERGDRVAVVLPPTPEAAAVFFATWKLGAILLSMSVLYGDEGIAHRLRDSEPKVLVTDAQNAARFDGAPVAQMHVLDGETLAGESERYAQDFRAVCSAGEPLNPEAIRWFRSQYGITVLDFYGLTESYPLCGNFPWMAVREGSMGRPMPGWDVTILDEDERPVPAGERGEICLRARSNPHYPLGYWRLPEASAEVFGGDWFHTKGAARMDGDGYVWYEGRADDVIISAGYRIGPFEVESVCLEHDAVAEAAAVAVPDERRGAVVKAFIVLAVGHDASEQL